MLVYAEDEAIDGLTFHPTYREPSLYYRRQADLSIAPDRQDFLLKAVITHLQAGEHARANEVLELLFAEPITTKQLTQSKLLKARLALTQQQPQKALDILYTLPPYSPYRLMVNQNHLLALAYAELGEPILSIEQRLSLNNRLKTPAATKTNNQAIWQTLKKMPAEQVNAVLIATANPTLAGWLALAHMYHQYQYDPVGLARAMANWKAQFLPHPGLDIAELGALAKKRMTAIDATPPHTALNRASPTPDLVQQHLPPPSDFIPIAPEQPPVIGVLLPKRGPLAPAAKAIEQGIMNAYFQEPQASRPMIQFYDSTDNARIVYHRAIQQGATLIIGPLAKNNVADVYRTRHFPVSTIALNDLPMPYARHRHTSDGFYQFSLAKEDEAYQAALRAVQSGQSNALIIRSEKNWGQQLDDAFSHHFTQLGGSVRERLTLSETADPAEPIKKLLQFTETPKVIDTPLADVNVEQDIEQQLKNDGADDGNDTDNDNNEITDATEAIDQAKPKLIYHRTDVDMIFLALTPLQAQRVIPLLKFYYAKDLPVYTTSIINTASIDDKHDLEGALFCDMPWLIENDAVHATLRQAVQKRWPDIHTTQPRLYAFGVDAYTIARALSQQQHRRLQQGLPGLTGQLHLRDDQKIFRELPWAQFTGKQIKRINTVPTPTPIELSAEP